MPVRYHIRDCKAALILTHVNSLSRPLPLSFNQTNEINYELRDFSMASGINIYSQLLNLNCCYQQFEALISTIRNHQ